MKDQVIVITGASAGIGAVVARKAGAVVTDVTVRAEVEALARARSKETSKLAAYETMRNPMARMYGRPRLDQEKGVASTAPPRTPLRQSRCRDA